MSMHSNGEREWMGNSSASARDIRAQVRGVHEWAGNLSVSGQGFKRRWGANGSVGGSNCWAECTDSSSLVY